MEALLISRDLYLYLTIFRVNLNGIKRGEVYPLQEHEVNKGSDVGIGVRLGKIRTSATSSIRMTSTYTATFHFLFIDIITFGAELGEVRRIRMLISMVISHLSRGRYLSELEKAVLVL